jgi:WS/DGAT/MGAT family acyltransferase
MHVGAVARFEAAPLRGPAGGVDIDRVRTFVRDALHDSPRFRQRLERMKVFDHPVWVDDAHFNLDYHVRHTALPAPGDERQLKRLAGRILSQKLDRGKPLWEMWVVDGLEQDRFGLIVKAHHAMVDGIAGIDLLGAILRLEPDAPRPEPREWIPRPPPAEARLVADEVWRRASLPLAAVRSAPDALRHPLEALDDVREAVAAVGEAIGGGLAGTTDTPLNPKIGPYRRFDWMQTPIEQVSEIRKHLGGTLNDVVLTTVAGAVGRFLVRRGLHVDEDTSFRVMVPVSIRRSRERGVPGNRVVNFLARLPVHESDPRRRLAATRQTLGELKRSRLVKGAEILETLGDRTFTGLVTGFVQLGASQRSYNMVVTNVPGPPRCLYLLEAPMIDIYPVVPLFRGQGLGIALFSYAGDLCWGLNACWDALPDLHDLVGDLGESFGELREAARRASQSDPGG